MQEWPARWRRRRPTLLSTPPLRRTAILRGLLSGIQQERYLGSMPVPILSTALFELEIEQKGLKLAEIWGLERIETATFGFKMLGIRRVLGFRMWGEKRCLKPKNTVADMVAAHLLVATVISAIIPSCFSLFFLIRKKLQTS